MKNTEPKEHPPMPEVEVYWKSLWGEAAEHNGTAEWIRRKQKRKISQMDWGPI
jgi:hypothetical protein